MNDYALEMKDLHKSKNKDSKAIFIILFKINVLINRDNHEIIIEDQNSHYWKSDSIKI